MYTIILFINILEKHLFLYFQFSFLFILVVWLCGFVIVSCIFFFFSVLVIFVGLVHPKMKILSSFTHILCCFKPA